MPDRPDNQAPGVPLPPVAGGEDRRSTRQHLDTDALSAFIDDRMAGDLRLDAAGHIAACPDCRNELTELRATVSLLGGLPQYRPRRSFVLGSEYAHPVRTSRLARLLPMLPALRAATVAVLLLLIGVGVADILTQVGEDSGETSRPAAVSGDTSGETAMQPPDEAANVARESAPAAVPPGDGTGGGGALSGTGPESAAGNADESVGSLDGDTGASEGSDPDGPIMGAVPRAPAPAAQSGQDGESQSAPADDSLEAASDADAGAPGAPASDPAPTVAIVAAAPDEPAGSSIAQADTSGTTSERAATTADDGVSNWRVIEVVLAVTLIALAALVIGLHRLSGRARRTGIGR